MVISTKDAMLNSVVYVDFENIFTRLESFRHDLKILDFSTKNSFNPIVVKFATFHLYIEDICNLAAPEPANGGQELIEAEAGVDPKKLIRAKEVAHLFYKSFVRKTALAAEETISLCGYIDLILGIVHRSSDEITEDFGLARSLKYVDLFEDPAKGTCIRDGERAELFKRNKSAY